MVVVIIFVTTLVTIIVLLITSAFYLISLICYDQSDDDDQSDALIIDTNQFSTTPTLSPAEPTHLSSTCANRNHRQHGKAHQTTVRHMQQPKVKKQVTSDDRPVIGVNPDDGPANTIANLLLAQESLVLSGSNSASNKPAPSNQIESPSRTPVSEQKNELIKQLGETASKQLFDDFDEKEMQRGGTGMHWCKTRKSLDKLVQLGLPLDGLNDLHETALHVAVRRRRLQVLTGLLCYGANVESRNDYGETPLISSCKVNDIVACQILLVFDADPNAVDNSGLSSRHYAASICDRHKNQQKLPSAAHLILAMLNEIGARRCPKEMTLQNTTEATDKANNLAQPQDCTDGCLHSGTYNGNSYNRWPDFDKESLYKRHMFMDIIEEHKRQRLLELSGKDKVDRVGHSESMENLNNQAKRSRMLCIDGGGMRGVIVCQIMIELQKYLKQPIINYFDWIGGTSVGAFMACALCTGTSLSQLRRISFDVKDEVFSGNKPYNSAFLERVFKRTYGHATRMSDVRDKKLVVTTVIADRDPCQLRLFRNYKSPNSLLEQCGFPADKFNILSGHSIVVRKTLSDTFGKTASSPSLKSSSLKTPELTSNKSLKSIDSSQNEQTTNDKMRGSDAPPKTTQKVYNRNGASNGSSSMMAVNRQTDNKDDQKSDTSNVMITEDEEDPFMWQAVRASAAAPFFFKPYGPYLDGGIISNNPTMDILTEFHSYERVKMFLSKRLGDESSLSAGTHYLDLSQDPPSKLEMVISLGTGRGRVLGRQAMTDFGQVASGFATVFSPVELLRSIRTARDLFKKLMQQSCQTEDHILDRAQAWCSSLGIPYFRINPPLSTIFSIDDKRDEQLINALWQTKLYMRSMSSQLKELGELLDGPSICDPSHSSDGSSLASVWSNTAGSVSSQE